MTAAEMKRAVESNLGLYPGEKELLVSDVILSVCDYCNLHPERIPDVLEPVIRKKVKGIIDYEAANGSGYQPKRGRWYDYLGADRREYQGKHL